MATLSISLLGPIHVVRDGQPVSFGYSKARALLAYLALEAGRPHERDALVGLLWPDLPNAAARTNLRQVLANLRQALDTPGAPPLLMVSRETIELRLEPGCKVDVTRMQALLDACEAHPHRHSAACRACAVRLEAAVALYQGELLAEFALGDCTPFEEWALLRREQLHQRIFDALTTLALFYERSGLLERAVELCRRQLALDCWREEVHQHLMRLLALAGQRSAALAQFERCHSLLKRELGVAPSAETVALRQHILEGGDGRTPAAVAPPQLPAWSSPLVGREADLERLDLLLAEPVHRLITLVGPGGVGKTRLAVAAARRQTGLFADGVCFVPLVGLNASGKLVPRIGEALGIKRNDESDPQAALLAFLHSRELLLVLDGVEHLRSEMAALVALLAAAPQLSLLVTSRERLNLDDERVYPVVGLARIPGAGGSTSSAEQLFLQSARRVEPLFAPSPEELSTIARICMLVDGLPLGIELAAAWVRTLPCVTIAARLAVDLDFLQHQRGDAEERHHSLRAVLDHSWRLLSPLEQRAACRLAVFRGGFTAEAAEEVAGAAVTDLALLLDKSLLSRGPSNRFVMHELVRQYAAEHLAASGEAQAALRSHCRFFAGLAQVAAVGLQGPAQGQWLEQLAAEQGNLWSALDWSLTEKGELSTGQRLADALGIFWVLRNQLQEGRTMLRQALAHACPEACAASLRAWAAELALRQNDDEEAVELARQAVALARRGGHRHAEARSLRTLGEAAEHGAAGVPGRQLPPLEAARALYVESLALFEELGDQWAVAAVLTDLGYIAAAQGASADAQHYYERSLRLRRALGDCVGAARTLNYLGDLMRYQGHRSQALRLFAEGLALARQVQDDICIGNILHNIAHVMLVQGSLAKAARHFLASLESFAKPGHYRGVIYCLAGLAAVAYHTARPALAIRLLGLGEALGGELSSVIVAAADLEVYQRTRAALHAATNEQTFAAELLVGRSLSLERALGEVQALYLNVETASSFSADPQQYNPPLLITGGSVDF